MGREVIQLSIQTYIAMMFSVLFNNLIHNIEKISYDSVYVVKQYRL